MIGESYDDRKRYLMNAIAESRELIRDFRETQKWYPKLDISPAIIIEQREIIEHLKELKAVGRYRIAAGLARDQPYQPKTTAVGAAAAKATELNIKALVEGLNGK